MKSYPHLLLFTLLLGSVTVAAQTTAVDEIIQTILSEPHPFGLTQEVSARTVVAELSSHLDRLGLQHKEWYSSEGDTSLIAETNEMRLHFEAFHVAALTSSGEPLEPHRAIQLVVLRRFEDSTEARQFAEWCRANSSAVQYRGTAQLNSQTPRDHTLHIFPAEPGGSAQPGDGKPTLSVVYKAGETVVTLIRN